MTVLSLDVLSMWVVYEHPTDYPEKYIARRWEIDGSTPDGTRTDEVIIADKLDRLQFSMSQKGIKWIPRVPGDEPHIVGVWL